MPTSQMYEQIRDLASQYLGYPITIDEENVRYVKGPTPWNILLEFIGLMIFSN